ncbi:MAG: putative hydrolase of the superfamily [Thermomicrobiales bacterium]|jgi:putative hydrolase of the HAD superfamily|nr:putative hydrolase of the superfamily [Thermomicrobiales bacterium]
MRIQVRERQTLIFDGDDTLWENNVYFERAIDDFIAYLDHSTLLPAEVRAVLDEIERANTQVHGYGAAAFGRSLRECYQHLHQRHLDETELATVMGFAERILSQPMAVIAGVEETLADLVSRHELALLTKGHDEEQRLKIDRSGLAEYFSRTFVVPEKHTAVYREVANDLGARPGVTWMIGNSPRSDINPALDAGLNAVFVPHDQTWRLEHADPAPAEPGRLLVLERFADLRGHF